MPGDDVRQTRFVTKSRQKPLPLMANPDGFA